LPKGIWYNVFNYEQTEVYEEGGKDFENVPIPNLILIFARGGSIIPSRERIRKSALLTLKDPFSLTIYLEHMDSST